MVKEHPVVPALSFYTVPCPRERATASSLADETIFPRPSTTSVWEVWLRKQRPISMRLRAPGSTTPMGSGPRVHRFHLIAQCPMGLRRARWTLSWT